MGAALLVSCASSSSGGDRPDEVQPGFIVWTDPISDRLDAPVDGVVTISPDGCVYLRSSPDSAQEPAIWPYGTTFDGTVIRTSDGVEIRDGDAVRSGGGEVEFEFDYYLDNTTLALDLELMLDCGGIEGDRITAFNPTQPIEIVTNAADSPEPDQQLEDVTPGQLAPPSSSGENTPTDPVAGSEDGAVDGPLMRHPVRSDTSEGLAAEVRGVLELEEDCLYLSIDEIDERYPVLWPAQTVWDAEREVVTLPTGDEIAVGGLAYGGGGYFYVDDIANIAGPEAADLAGRCADNTYGEIAVVNNYDTAISPG